MDFVQVREGRVYFPESRVPGVRLLMNFTDGYHGRAEIRGGVVQSVTGRGDSLAGAIVLIRGGWITRIDNGRATLFGQYRPGRRPTSAMVQLRAGSSVEVTVATVNGRERFRLSAASNGQVSSTLLVPEDREEHLAI